jgi:sucrose phosphorylase
LDTHDGYGVIDGGPIGGRPGLITQDEMAFIFKKAEENTGGHSAIASVIPQWFDLPHQINATLPNILANDTAYVISRMVQFLLPGEPQVYYVGLFNGMDDQELFAKSGQGRDVNRHHYTPAEIEQALQTEVTQAIIAMARMRRSSAFEGDFSWQVLASDKLAMSWTGASEELYFEFATTVGAPSFRLTHKSASGERVFNTTAELASF